MISPNTTSREQLECYLSALFLPDELVELRFIESWTSRGGKRGRVVRSAEWLRPHDILAQYAELTSFAEESWTNIYCGVCPRTRNGDSRDQSVQTIRCVWCDVDQVTAGEAEERWREVGVPQPSLLVRSGSGIHAYWLLDHDLDTRQERSRLVGMLPHFYRSFGGDRVQNPSRVLRPPGTVNYKDARNGRAPRRCKLLRCDSDLRYSLEAFWPWIDLAVSQAPVMSPSDYSNSADSSSPGVPPNVQADAIELVRRLDRPSADRSRRDFAIICDLLRLGLSTEEIWELVSGRSKFQSNGRSYFEVTVSNAERMVASDPVCKHPFRATP